MPLEFNEWFGVSIPSDYLVFSGQIGSLEDL